MAEDWNIQDTYLDNLSVTWYSRKSAAGKEEQWEDGTARRVHF